MCPGRARARAVYPMFTPTENVNNGQPPESTAPVECPGGVLRLCSSATTRLQMHFDDDNDDAAGDGSAPHRAARPAASRPVTVAGRRPALS